MSEKVTVVDWTTPLVFPHHDTLNPGEIRWGLYMRDVQRTTQTTTFGDLMEVEWLGERFGYWPLLEGDKPEDDVVTEVAPIQDEDGNWIRQYTHRKFTEEEIANNLRDAKFNFISQIRDIVYRSFQNGFTYESGDDKYQFSLDDASQSYIRSAHLLAKEAFDTSTARDFKLRTIENVTITFSAEETVDVTTALLNRVVSVVEASWALEDAINAAATLEEIPAVPDLF